MIRTALDSKAETPPEIKQSATPDRQEISGTLSAWHTRFLYTDTPQGRCIVFLDISVEQNMRASLIRSCLLIGIAGFLLFFLISILFARWAVKPVQNAWEEQKQFVADASHELKTPLTVILTNAELLQSPEYNPAAKTRFAENILTLAQEMRALVEELLDLSRADRESMKLAMEPVNLSAAIEQSVCLFEPLFFENSQALCNELESGIWVNGSPAHLKQVTDILLENALKYSDNGSAITIKLERQHRHCLLSVASYGDTISPDDLKKIFQRFYRIDQSRTGSGSYGLGLSIAESIVRKHHGKIWAESADGHNTFFVRLKTTGTKKEGLSLLFRSLYTPTIFPARISRQTVMTGRSSRSPWLPTHRWRPSRAQYQGSR